MLIVAVCDDDLIGKIFCEGELQIEVHRDFYEGELETKEAVLSALQEADIANIVGRRSIECAIECGCINPKNVITIDGVPHAQMLRINY
jgi:hypothetical protein